MVRNLAILALLVSPSLAAANPFSAPQPSASNFARSESPVLQPQYLREPVTPVQRAARAFGTCVRHSYAALPAGLAAEPAALRLMQGCDAALQAVAAAADQAIAESRLSDGRKQAARAQLRARLALVPQRLAASVRASRPLGTDLFAR